MDDQAPSIVLERVLPAPPEVVFRAITHADLFARWMGPEGSVVEIEEMEVAVGGRLAFRVALPDGGPQIRLRGRYEEVVEPSRLVHSWAMDGEPATSTVTFDLEPDVGGGTRLRLEHHGLPIDDIAQNEAGWRHQVDRLAAVVA